MQPHTSTHTSTHTSKQFARPRGLILLAQQFMVFALFTTAFSALQSAGAWGRVGHDLIARSSAQILAEEELAKDGAMAKFLKSRSYDLGYYANVPDLIWKRPATYDIEWTNHFMDLEIFEREFAKMDNASRGEPLMMDRLAFDAKFPGIDQKAGRAFWRIRELEERLKATTGLLKQKDVLKEERHRLQGEWLVTAGVIAHYIGNLSQPLHTTENYDGQLTDQVGIHAHFEDQLVDEAWPGLISQVQSEAMRQWKKVGGEIRGLSTVELLKKLTNDSLKEVPELLRRDKKNERLDSKKALEIHRSMIIRRMAAGSVFVAELWRRYVQWTPNEDKFYVFFGEPAYISPPTKKP